MNGSDAAGRYIAFDVETPNRRNDRMSAIGITVVEGGRVAEEYDFLVNPEEPFDPFNIWLTGITLERTAAQPNFAALWTRIGPILDSGLLVAHNAPFDMGVLARCLAAYGIRWRPYACYLCTCAMGRRCYPGLDNHRLDTLCDRVGIELNHHRAGSDSRACALLLLDYLERGLAVRPFLRRYDLARGRTARP